MKQQILILRKTSEVLISVERIIPKRPGGKKTTLIWLVLISILTILTNHSFANNVSITNLSVPDADHIQFDITWNNSWYTATNYDAIWIFIKSQDCAGTSTWDHTSLSLVAGNHSVTGGLYVEPSTDGKGVFIRLNANGFGTQTGTALLNFSASIPAFATTNFRVFGIEMVWIPQATFQVGDGSVNNTAGTSSAYNYGSPSNTTAPYIISTEAAIAANTLSNTKGATNCNTQSDYNVAYNQVLSASFPKGFAGFYCMKYEISQQQYVAFLNCLSLGQQSSRVVAPPASAIGTFAMSGGMVAVNRNSIVIKTPAAAGAPAVYDNDLNADLTYGDGGDIACNYLSWDDLKSYLDWAALRPKTELEYEKICRGTASPTVREYPWSSTTLTIASSASINFGGTSNEVSTAIGNGLCCFGAGGTGPLRCGFAATAVSGRTDAGASYYGVLEMGGNVWEQCINTGWLWYTVACPGTATVYPIGGVIYTGVLGNGALDASGNADAANWGDSRYSIIKGGSWSTPNNAAGLQQVQISDRTNIFNLGAYANNSRNNTIGGRGVRKP